MHIFLGFCGLLIDSVFCGLLAAVLWLRLRTGVRHLDAALFLALWFFIVTMFVMCACALAILDARTMTLASLVGSMAVGLLFRHDWPLVRAVSQGCMSAVTGFFRQWPGLSILYSCLAFTIALRTFAHAWFLPPYVWDTLVYHLPRIAEWIQHRGLFVIDTSIDRLYWPANFELFQCWFVLFFHHDFIIELAGVFPYALAILSVYSISRSFGATPPWAGAAAVLYSTTPSLLLAVVSCKNDIAVAGWFLFMVAVIAEMAKARGPLLVHGRYVAILAMAFGIALGTKPYIVFIAPGLVLLYVLLLFNREIRSQTRDGKELRVVWLSIVMLLALFVGLFWYLRNAVAFGNPFYPSDFRLLGHVITGTGMGPEYAHSEFKWQSVAESYKLLPLKLFDRESAFTPEIPGMAGWGCFAVACGIPAVVLMLFSRSPSRIFLFSCLLSLTCLFGFVLPDAWNLRYALWFPGVFAVAFVLLVPCFRVDSVRGALLWLAGLCAAVNIAATLNNGYLSADDWRRQFHTPVLKRSSALLNYDDELHALRIIPRGETFCYEMFPNGWLYPLYGADYAWKVKYLDVLGTFNVPDEMRRDGVRYLFIAHCGKMIKAKIGPYLDAGSLRDLGQGLYALP